MNPLESQLTYPFEQILPAPGSSVEIAPGLLWIRMPLPFALDHINLWLLRDRYEGRDGWTAIDCGVANHTIRQLWETLFADSLDGLPILRVLCTHMHPDHVGLADFLTRRFDAPLWMTLGEYASGRLQSCGAPGTDNASLAAHFARHGATADQVAAICRGTGSRFSALVPAMPLSFTRVIDGQQVRIGDRSWRVVIGLGHSPEHASLYCETDRLLISGDMVLPRISTNCSVFQIEPESNPVRWFLDSLKRFDGCDGDTLVLPSHGRPFRRLAVRLKQLSDHHAERLERIGAACRAAPLTAADAVPILFDGRRFDDHQLMFAIGESLAHLHALWHDGAVGRFATADGVFRFGAN